MTTTIETLWGRRDRLNIIAEIMEVATERKVKTQIMYMVNLSFNQLKEYLNYLTERGFLRIRVENEKKFYETTAKGIRYIENYREMSNFLRPLEQLKQKI